MSNNTNDTELPENGILTDESEINGTAEAEEAVNTEDVTEEATPSEESREVAADSETADESEQIAPQDEDAEADGEESETAIAPETENSTEAEDTESSEENAGQTTVAAAEEAPTAKDDTDSDSIKSLPRFIRALIVVHKFLTRKDVILSPKRYGIDAMGAMAFGLFGSLLIGTIFGAIGLIPHLEFFKTIGDYGKSAAGCAMAVAIAYALKAPPLVIYSTALVGFMANTLGGSGGPLAVLIIAIIATECGKAVSKETKVDILVTPFVTVLVGGLLSLWLAPPIGKLVGYVGEFIGWATLQQPLIMGIIISVVIGIALTLPISSAAICAGLGLSGIALVSSAIESASAEGLALAGGAAVAGCCAQMVGFAVMSFRENGWGGIVSQGLGTSMLQMPNIVKKPIIWLPPTIASAITGPLATCLFEMKMYGAAINSGMGTCGLLGPVGIILGWFGGDYPGTVGATDWIGLILICFILPAALSLLICELMRRLGWIKFGDLKLGS